MQMCLHISLGARFHPFSPLFEQYNSVSFLQVVSVDFSLLFCVYKSGANLRATIIWQTITFALTLGG